jgi:DNA repair protein RadC
MERGERMIYLQDSKIQILNSRESAKVFLDLLLGEDDIDQSKEHFYVAHLDTRSRINMVELVSLGTLTSSLVHPRETFRRAIMQGSACIIVGHNHPSGEVDPSGEDTRVTKTLFDAGKLLGIDMLDHVIFSPKAFFSFRENKIVQIEEGGGNVDEYRGT